MPQTRAHPFSQLHSEADAGRIALPDRVSVTACASATGRRSHPSDAGLPEDQDSPARAHEPFNTTFRRHLALINYRVRRTSQSDRARGLGAWLVGPANDWPNPNGHLCGTLPTLYSILECQVGAAYLRHGMPAILARELVDATAGTLDAARAFVTSRGEVCDMAALPPCLRLPPACIRTGFQVAPPGFVLDDTRWEAGGRLWEGYARTARIYGQLIDQLNRSLLRTVESAERGLLSRRIWTPPSTLASRPRL
ncbi:hypothetical protein ACVWWJ_002671 [Luteibacter sp. HA06]